MTVYSYTCRMLNGSKLHLLAFLFLAGCSTPSDFQVELRNTYSTTNPLYKAEPVRFRARARSKVYTVRMHRVPEFLRIAVRIEPMETCLVISGSTNLLSKIELIDTAGARQSYSANNWPRILSLASAQSVDFTFVKSPTQIPANSQIRFTILDQDWDLFSFRHWTNSAP